MSSIYHRGTVGPWYADDDEVQCDGYIINSELIGGNTVDGITGPRRPHIPGSDDLRKGRVLRESDRGTRSGP